MLTGKQNELIKILLSSINEEEKIFCEPIIEYLVELGYIPKKRKKSSFLLDFEKNGRIISKFELQKDKENKISLLFWLRFSANKNYSKIFLDAVAKRPESWIKRNQFHKNHKIENCCGWCKGKPVFYYFLNDDGIKIIRCGGYTLPIEGVTENDIPEIIILIKEQDKHFSDMLEIK
jgi:hypothetical protein